LLLRLLKLLTLRHFLDDLRLHKSVVDIGCHARWDVTILVGSALSPHLLHHESAESAVLLGSFTADIVALFKAERLRLGFQVLEVLVRLGGPDEPLEDAKEGTNDNLEDQRTKDQAEAMMLGRTIPASTIPASTIPASTIVLVLSLMLAFTLILATIFMPGFLFVLFIVPVGLFFEMATTVALVDRSLRGVRKVNFLE